MQEKTNEPKAMVVLNFDKQGEICAELVDGKIQGYQPDGGFASVQEIFVLDDGDTMAWNSSTNYDHHMSGPSLVIQKRQRGKETNEKYVNCPDTWRWIERMMRLGALFIKEHPEFDAWDYDEQLKKEFEARTHYVSMHKKEK